MKISSEKYSVSSADACHDVTIVDIHGILQNIKKFILHKRKMTFPRHEKFQNCLKYYVSRICPILQR